ncbi:ribosome biogenesis GTP-binding protein YihA/YsxC [Pyrinomonas methylaliphatogenes]|uniref:Probable GTP-binding protein EngB n=1 Tax=Pyrinomonas methylaliphatogenes TaxID=454194 RepID=A0A0B6WX36_9BACT|nr:ribosome biogenesis GTP-binding protein YihA/YsxC [Pyrinomonas methylaliphatogenes]CDM65611.1 ribosome biogenesis GTP-binding protein YsxC/EngB [Pyrinomonas methylaliphatogenes]
MKITSAEFICSAASERDWPTPSLPEIAFLGRSNVGKSSLINSLLGRRLARTSATPGRTQTLNFFLINGRFRFVDLPGYGYARVPERVRRSWGEMATTYLAKRRELVLSIHIVDSRHDPTELDLQLHEWLEYHEKPQITVATKSDKLSQNELRRNIERIRRKLGAEEIIPYSALTKQGYNEVWRAIERALAK